MGAICYLDIWLCGHHKKLFVDTGKLVAMVSSNSLPISSNNLIEGKLKLGVGLLMLKPQNGQRGVYKQPQCTSSLFQTILLVKFCGKR